MRQDEELRLYRTHFVTFSIMQEFIKKAEYSCKKVLLQELI